jgi:hypothetical protein
MILRLSGEKGIQFLFPSSTPRAQREAVWIGLADLAEAAQTVVSAAEKGETPSDSLVAPAEWWNHATENLRRIEAEDKTVSAFMVMFYHMGVSPAVNVDAIIARPNELRGDFMEFPTEGMMRHYESVLKKRMEGQAMQLSLIRWTDGPESSAE